MPNVLSKPGDPKGPGKVRVSWDQGSTNSRGQLGERNGERTWAVFEHPDIVMRASSEAERAYIAGYSAILVPEHLRPDLEPLMFGADVAEWQWRVTVKSLLLLMDDTRDLKTGRPRRNLIKRMPNGDKLWRLLCENPQFTDEGGNKISLRKFARREVVKHVKHGRDLVEAKCRRNNLVIDDIVVTMPDWLTGEHAECDYMNIVAEVYGIDAKSIKWVGEAQAVAHAIIDKMPDKLHGRTVLAAIDVGGTAINWSIVMVWPSKDGNVLMVEIDTGGEIGGGDLWEMAASHKIETKLRAALPDGQDLDVAHRDLLRIWRLNHRKKPGQDATLIIPAGPHARRAISLTGIETLECFKQGVGNAVLKVMKRVEKLAKEHDGEIALVFSGGTTVSGHLRETVKDRVREIEEKNVLGHKLVVEWSRSWDDWENPAGIVAMGANIAAEKASKLSLAKIIENGGAFGIQFHDRANQYGGVRKYIVPLYGAGVPDGVEVMYPPSDTAHWDYGCPTLKIVCDGAKEVLRPKDLHLCPENDCYDVFNVPTKHTHRKGRYTANLHARLEADGSDTMVLGLEFESTVKGKKVHERIEAEIPLYIQISSNTILAKPDEARWSDWKPLSDDDDGQEEPTVQRPAGFGQTDGLVHEDESFQDALGILDSHREVGG